MTTDATGSRLAAELPRQVADWRTMVDRRLAQLWPEPGGGDELEGLAQAIRYSLLAPGKRIRPVLALAAADACGEKADRVLDVAVAFELAHTYSLVHDDLPCMDDDDLRRGMPTSHKRFGEGVAVLVGDALQAEAFRLVAAAVHASAEQRLHVVELLATAAGWRGMVGGQYSDIAGGRDAHDREALLRLHARKTGALIEAAVTAGAVVGNAGSDGLALWSRLGRELGLLFQLVDDLLDAVGDSSLTGKQTGSDQRGEKVTGVDVYGIAGLAEAADSQLTACLSTARQLPDGGGAIPDIARYVRLRDR